MCVQCLVYSTFSLFMPAPQQAELPPVVSVDPIYSQVQTTSVAKEGENAIARILDKLPTSSDTRMLREGLESLKAKLTTVKDNEQAENLIDDELLSLSERLKNEPNDNKVTEILMKILEVEENQSSGNFSDFNALKSQLSRGISLQSTAKNFGWLS